MAVGSHYLDEDVAKRIVTIPIAAALLDDWIEDTLQLIDDRINLRCYLGSNTTDTMEKAGLASVELNALLKVLQNTRLSREGVPAEISFIDAWFSAEDKFLLQDIRGKHKFVVAGYSGELEL